jgi:hypothetical protein
VYVATEKPATKKVKEGDGDGAAPAKPSARKGSGKTVTRRASKADPSKQG